MKSWEWKRAGRLDLAALAGKADHRITVLPYRDTGAAIASGSFKTDGMVVVPCSNNKLAELAHGLGDNLISRAAQVCLKERRRLVIVHREMPLGLIEIKNMLEVTQAGAIVCPANPGFYHLPQTVDDVVNTVAARVLDLLDVPHALSPRWTGRSRQFQSETSDLIHQTSAGVDCRENVGISMLSQPTRWPTL